MESKKPTAPQTDRPAPQRVILVVTQAEGSTVRDFKEYARMQVDRTYGLDVQSVQEWPIGAPWPEEPRG